MLLTADGDARADAEQRLRRQKDLQLDQIAEPHADLPGEGDHHAAEQAGQHAALPAELPRHHHVRQKHHDQQQALDFRRQHHLRADTDNENRLHQMIKDARSGGLGCPAPAGGNGAVGAEIQRSDRRTGSARRRR